MKNTQQEKTAALNVHVVSFTGDSGLTDYSVSLCRHLSKMANVTLVTGLSYDKNKYRTEFSEKKIFRRTRYYPIDILKFIFYILRSRPDIVLFQSWLKYPIIEGMMARLFRIMGIRVALTIHDLMPHIEHRWSRWELRRYYKCFDRLVVHSQRTADGLASMGVDTLPLVVPHGIYDIFNIDKLSRSAAIAEFPGIQQNDFVVLFFGHLDARKGIDEFLQASVALLGEKNIKFLVAGAPASQLSDPILQKISTCRQNDNIVLHDFSIPFERVQYYFAAANAVALPYREGTTSGVIKLAMAFELPIIVTDIGDFSETLNDWPGLLIEGDITSGLIAAIREMRDSYHATLETVQSASKKYQWEEIAEKHFYYLSAA